MSKKKSPSLVASAVSLALSSMMLSAGVNAGEIQGIDQSNFVPYVEGTTYRTILDRPFGTAGAVSYGEIGWDVLKAMDPGVIVYNNTPAYGTNQIIADCVMAPRIDALLIPQTDGTFLDKQCNDSFQSHKRYKMSATAIGPIDMVFTVKNVDNVLKIYDKDGVEVSQDQDTARNVYRVIGKLNNHTGARMGGFTVQVGFGLGSGFYKSKANDGLKISLTEEDSSTDLIVPVPYGDNDMAEFPGGLFYGPADDKHDYGFFSSSRAGFTVDTAALATEEDFFGSVTITENYSTLFGTWLPIDKVPQGWFYDFDGNPATDASLTAWDYGTDFTTWNDGKDWRYGNDPVTGLQIDPAGVPPETLATWANTPSTVWDTRRDQLFATWDATKGLYVLVDGVTTLTNDDMTLVIANTIDGFDLERRAGYFKGPVEDLANLNLNYYIEVADASAWPTYNTADGTATFTLRITPLADGTTEVLPPASETAPVVPTTTTPIPTSSDGGGCTVGGSGRFDPTLPALLAMGLGFFGWRRFKTGN
jgi:hypothetical protein